MGSEPGGFGKTGGSGRFAWLLIKHRNRYASAKDITAELPRSVRSKKLLFIAKANHGNVKAAKGDPKNP